ncbi:hypothetical protein AGMMS49975_11630 [Clostridia bacterium]|nr:hypothetical protein AGMMS49975_11630 [Clostridia bacterium]
MEEIGNNLICEVERMRGLLAAHNEYVSKNPSKEVKLLNALREYAPDERKTEFDNIIGTLKTIEMIKRLSGVTNI